MGNRMSKEGGGGAIPYYHLDDGEVMPEPYESKIPRLRGGDGAHCVNGIGRDNGHWAGPSTTTDGAHFDHLSTPSQEAGAGSDFYEVPAENFYAAKSLCRGLREYGPAMARATLAGDQFDFNDDQQPNPWHGTEPQVRRQRELGREPECEPEPACVPDDGVQLRRFASCHDRELRAYLAARSISHGFLTEIDQFMQGHPEIATCAEGRSTLRQLTTLPPLEAYKYFLKGYTRPARYLDGIVRSDYFPLPLDYPYQPLSTKHDPELDDFFAGFDYRYDIIDRIDQEVRMGMKELAYRRPVPLALRKLICYALWGNPVDAYKWFEYSYQNEYMPHRYLPEHVVLGHIAKPAKYEEPRPSILTGYKKHGDVRARMARANDQGVDVLDVLIAEYRFALVRKAHRQVEIDELVSKAKRRLEVERRDPTGVDIVDMIMDDAVAREGTNRRYPPRRTYPRNHKTFNLGTHSVTFNGLRFNGGTHTFTRVNARRAPGPLQAQAAELRQAKATLLRLYNQERNALANRGINTRESSLMMIRVSRATTERRYVHCLIRYLRDAGRMTSFQAAQLQRDFTRERMSDVGVCNSNYLLEIYPRELY